MTRNARAHSAGCTSFCALLLWACSSTPPATTPDAGREALDAGTLDAGTAPDAGPPPSACGAYARETVNGTCTSSITWEEGPFHPFAKDHHATGLVNRNGTPWLVVAGGAKDSFAEIYSHIHGVQLNENGEVVSSQWELIGDLPLTISGHTLTFHDGFAYVTGGQSERMLRRTVYYAPIANLGDPNAWQQTSTLPTGVWHHQAFVHDGHLYVVGGQRASQTADDGAHRAPINADGTVGTFESLAPLPNVLSHYGYAVSPIGVYVIGGLENDAFRGTVFFGRFEADGRINSWEDLGTVPGGGLVTPSVTIVDRQLIVIAGLTADLRFVGNVVSASLDEDGRIQTWKNVDRPLPTGRGHVHQMPTMAGKVYVVGGRSGRRSGARFLSLDGMWVGQLY